jgi:pyruvate formate lyase activating enzyme
MIMHVAAYWVAAAGGAVRCELCPTRCVVAEGEEGSCLVRGNRGGRLVALNYGKVAAAALDPIEKKPLFHFWPGSRVYSLGPPGCNLHCAFCQNWQYSQGTEAEGELSPEAAVAGALAARAADPAVVGLCFTYTDPVVWFEFVVEAGTLARRAGLVNVLKTNGYVNAGPWADLLAVADAVNVDVKAFTEGFYRRVCRGSLRPVLEAVEAARRAGRHVEVTNLLIPGENDGPAEVEALARWLSEVDPRIPLHLARFFPNYRMDGEVTPGEALEEARAVARRFLRHVYVTGAWGPDHGVTRCPDCGAEAIRRDGFRVGAPGVRDGRCAACGGDLDVRGPVRERA